MTDVSSIINALRREYPIPQVEAQWVQECVQALVDDGQEPSFEAVQEQFLFSDLAVSTTPPPASLVRINAHKIRLFPKPTLVQILSMTEIGSSAFQLQTVAEQRKDILSGQTLIRRMDDEQDDEQIAEGKLPVYPRGMLKFELGLGDGRAINAVEYRRIGGIMLGETGLGAKLRLKNVKALRGILMLDPGNCEYLGYSVDHLEAEQPIKFLAGLARRMGKDEQPAQPDTRTPRARPRVTQTRLSFSPSKSPKSDVEVIDTRAHTPPLSARRPARAASTAASARVATLYTQTALTNDAPRGRAVANHARAPTAHIVEDDEDDFDDDDFDDSFFRQVDAVEATATRAAETNDDDEMNWEEWGYADEAEVAPAPRAQGHGARTSRFFPPQKEDEVYMIDSDDDSGKENKRPEPIYISD